MTMNGRRQKDRDLRHMKNEERTAGLLDKGGADRVNSVSTYLKERFGKKMIKLAIDCGFTCPNRDGTLSERGCVFCGDKAGGDFASRADAESAIKASIDEQIAMYEKKWPDAGYIAYFQSHTNTYSDLERLRRLYYAALGDPRISGIAIATRPDCLPGGVLDLLSEINKEHFMWIELGLQTANEKTAVAINRCYGLEVYDKAAQELCDRDIKIVTHLILGLPGETEDDMKASVRYVMSKNRPWGVKLHLLNVVKGSVLGEEHPDYVPFESISDYVDLVCDIVEMIPEDVVIHRLTGDAPRSRLISPAWSYRKRTILNSIHAELKKRGSRQGSAL